MQSNLLSRLLSSPDLDRPTVAVHSQNPGVLTQIAGDAQLRSRQVALEHSSISDNMK